MEVHGSIFAEDVVRNPDHYVVWFAGGDPRENPEARKRVEYVAETELAYASGKSDELHGYESGESIGVLARRVSDGKVWHVTASGQHRARALGG